MENVQNLCQTTCFKLMCRKSVFVLYFNFIHSIHGNMRQMRRRMYDSEVNDWVKMQWGWSYRFQCILYSHIECLLIRLNHFLWFTETTIRTQKWSWSTSTEWLPSNTVAKRDKVTHPACSLANRHCYLCNDYDLFSQRRAAER